MIVFVLSWCELLGGCEDLVFVYVFSRVSKSIWRLWHLSISLKNLNVLLLKATNRNVWTNGVLQMGRILDLASFWDGCLFVLWGRFCRQIWFRGGVFFT